MDRITHSSAVDIGGGRRGFRSKDTVGGVPGTVVTATHMNATQEEMVSLIEKAGLAPDGADLAQLLKAIRSNALNHRVAGGTANALTIALDPAPGAIGELLAVPLSITTAVANTGPVTLKVGALAAVAVRTADGLELLGGALPAGTIFDVAHNGTYFQLLSIVPASAAKAPAAFAMTTNTGQSVTASTQTVVTNFASTFNDLIDSTLAANQITIGAKDAGWWVFGCKLQYDFPASGTMYTNVIIERNGSEIGSGNAPGTTSIRARPSAVVPYKVAAGDVIRLSTTTDISRSLNSGASIFSGFKVGA